MGQNNAYQNNAYQNTNQKMILMIGSSTKNSKFQEQRSSISSNNKGVPLTGVKYDIIAIKQKFNN